jgi:GNAT superfamily N-acetyltransferase
MNRMEAMPTLEAPVVARLVRPATGADVPRIVEMGMRFAQMVYGARLRPDPEALSALALRLMGMADSTLLVAEQDGAVVGMIGMMVYRHPMSAELVGTEVAWWIDPEHRGIGLRLLRAGETWARAQGAVTFQMIAPTPDVERLYERMGFERMETTFQRRLS